MNKPDTNYLIYKYKETKLVEKVTPGNPSAHSNPLTPAVLLNSFTGRHTNSYDPMIECLF